MKNKIFFLTFLIAVFYSFKISAKEETREVSPFSEIALRVSAKVYVVQGEKQSVRIVANSETLDELITEVKNRSLIIRFPSNTIFKKWEPGKIEIYISVPEITGLNVSGSGDIIADAVKTRILNLVVSGSGNIKIKELNTEKIIASVTGSGNIEIEDGGIAEELKARISGSGNINASGIEINNIDVQTLGSGNCSVLSNGLIKAKIAGSGNVYYTGNPAFESSVTGSGKVTER